MSFIKRLITEFTAPLEASMTKKPSSAEGPLMGILKHVQREFGAGYAQRRGYEAAGRAGGISITSPIKKARAIVSKQRRKGSPRGRRTGESQAPSTQAPSTQAPSTQAPSTQAPSTPSTRTRPARPARTRPARTRPARPARTRKKPSENDDDDK